MDHIKGVALLVLLASAVTARPQPAAAVQYTFLHPEKANYVYQPPPTEHVPSTTEQPEPPSMLYLPPFQPLESPTPPPRDYLPPYLPTELRKNTPDIYLPPPSSTKLPSTTRRPTTTSRRPTTTTRNSYLPPNQNGYLYDTPKIPILHRTTKTPTTTPRSRPPPTYFPPTTRQPPLYLPPTTGQPPPYLPPNTRPPPIYLPPKTTGYVYEPPTKKPPRTRFPPRTTPRTRAPPTYLPPYETPRTTPHTEHVHEPGMPFEYRYDVADAPSGNDFSASAVSDGDVVKGEYRVALPDGCVQLVRYTADWKNGYNAEVTYEGTAVCPKQDLKYYY